MNFFLLMFLLASPTVPTAHIPPTCVVGDLIDSYDGHEHWKACRTANVWSPLETPKEGESSITFVSSPWEPVFRCRLQFTDSDHNTHCPFETASGRVVACEPCHTGGKDCDVWYAECAAFVNFQRNHQTAEPTPVDSRTVRYDHSETGNYSCPENWYLKWMNRDHSYHSPICVKSKEAV